jgi:predicted enzyme related to lactoylglutathione lyase
MTTAITTRLHRPAWVDLASPDAAASRDFYSKLFGWEVSVNPDPQYGGYAIAQIGDEQVGGIGPTQSPQQPTAWSLYIGSDDVDALAARVPGLGGQVLAPPFDVGDQGRMATFADPSGAVISAWQASTMRPWRSDWSNTYGWAELTTRGLSKAIPFYEQLFGWTSKTDDVGGGQTYTQFAVDGEQILGAVDTPPEGQESMAGYWMVYFNVENVDAMFARALELGAKEIFAPSDFFGGRFAIVQDPQGAMFGIVTSQS